MTVQIQPAKPKDEHNGLAAIEDAILAAPPHDLVVAIVTYERVKRVEDEAKGETYPVMKVRHIEPILGDLTVEATALQEKAYTARTGENQLDLDFAGEKDAEGDE